MLTHTAITVAQKTLKDNPPIITNNISFPPLLRFAITNGEVAEIVDRIFDENQDLRPVVDCDRWHQIKVNLQKDAKTVESYLKELNAPYIHVWESGSILDMAIKKDVIFVREDILSTNKDLDAKLKQTHSGKIRVALCRFFYQESVNDRQNIKVMRMIYVCIYKLKFYAKFMLSESFVYGNSEKEISSIQNRHQTLCKAMKVKNGGLFNAVDKYLDLFTGINVKENPSAIDYYQASLKIRIMLRRHIGQYALFLEEIKKQILFMDEEYCVGNSSSKYLGTVSAKISSDSYKVLGQKEQLAKILSEQ